VVHSGNGIVSVKLVGEVRNAPVLIMVTEGEDSTFALWHPKQSEIVLPLLLPTNGKSISIGVSAPGAQATLELRELSLVSEAFPVELPLPEPPKATQPSFVLECPFSEPLVADSFPAFLFQIEGGSGEPSTIQLELYGSGESSLPFESPELRGQNATIVWQPAHLPKEGIEGLRVSWKGAPAKSWKLFRSADRAR
jgi:hypothetical protein